ncbi:hypothetical protein TNCV_4527741 [Trichonephila clavipes]|nr:hypothetical protein TNCV_4527741 [Trichonephila clavipes]
MAEEKLLDHIISRLEPQLLDYVEVRHPQTTSSLLQLIDKYEASIDIIEPEKKTQWQVLTVTGAVTQVTPNSHDRAVYLQVDDHVHPGNCPAAVSSKKNKTRPSSYGVLPSPAELGYERTDVVFFFIF